MIIHEIKIKNKILYSLFWVFMTFISFKCLASDEIDVIKSKLPPCRADQNAYRDNCFGTYIYAENTKWQGDKYIGEFKDGRFNGQGKWIHGPKSPDAGSIYIGSFKDDEFYGLGTWIYPNGDKYVGQWKDDMCNGQGTHTWSNGHKYVGQWKNDMQHGEGTYTWSNGNKYSGIWKKDKQDGEGIFIFANGDRYIGYWKDNQKHGPGTFIYANGDKFIGEFKDNNKYGKGTFIYANGEKEKGTWKDDSLIYKEPVSVGLIESPNVNNKEGRFIAVLIANEDYKYISKLKTPVKDINEVATILKSNYGFETIIIKNANHEELVSEISQLNKKINSQDHLLIYYAGHGTLDDKEGFWLPIDAKLENESKWLSHNFIIRKIKKIKAINILLIADSCFSGALLSRGIVSIDGSKQNNSAIDLFLKTKSRIVISSGGLKPVLDGGGGDHSIFARMFINALTTNTKPMTSYNLFNKINQKVTEQALDYNIEQTPEIGTLERAGHVGRDFVFLPK